eukprot:8693645-Pyramimonas_sp.AAC.1
MPSGVRVGASWGLFWTSGGPLGASWGLLGCLLGPPGGFLGPRTRNFSSGPPPGPPLGAVLEASWAVLGPSWT